MAFHSIRDDDAYAAIIERLRRFTPDRERKWGVMAHDELLPHFIDGMQLALNGTDGSPKGLMTTPLMRHLLIHRLSWPEGKVKAPDGAFQRVAEDWDAERDELIALIDRYRSTPPERVGGAHPTFGSMKSRDWDVMVWRHLDHHLRQFDC
jgi:hypothetical protein